MESFNRGEHVVAAFLDIEKAFDNVWHNGLRYKLFILDLPTKMTRRHSQGRIKLNPEKAKVIIFSRTYLARNSEPILKLYGERLRIYLK